MARFRIWILTLKLNWQKGFPSFSVTFGQSADENFTHASPFCLSDLYIFSLLFKMASFTIFADERLEGVDEVVATLNNTGNSLKIICIWDATNGQLGRAAFAHHIMFPADTLVVTPSILDLFTFDEEVGIYFPLFSTVEAAVAYYAQAFNDVVLELLALPVPPQVIFTDLVGVDTLTWAPVFGDATVQAWADSIVPRVNEEIDRVNNWNGVPGVPLGHRILYTGATRDGLIRVHDFRAMVDRFLPSPRQRGRCARVIIGLLRMFVQID